MRFKILVAEDNHVNQEVIKRMLNLEGINNIDLACDGQDAFDKVQSLVEQNDSYDMIFIDIQMPKVDGLLSTKMIRRDLNYKGSIVALTAFADDSNIKECIEAGMNGFLSKPIKRPKLKMILEEYCPNWIEMKKSKENKDGDKKLKKINPKKNEQSSCSLSRVVIEQFTSIFYNELHSHFLACIIIRIDLLFYTIMYRHRNDLVLPINSMCHFLYVNDYSMYLMIHSFMRYMLHFTQRFRARRVFDRSAMITDDLIKNK